MGACHWERAEVLQRVQRVRQRLDEVLRQEPADRPAIEQLWRELLRASEALAALPDCSE
jgi:hypothetical protein